MTRPTEDDIVWVRLKPDYPDHMGPPHSQEFPTSDTDAMSSQRVFYAIHNPPFYRLIIKVTLDVAEQDPRGTDFYDDITTPEGYIGWNVPEEYCEVINMATYAISANTASTVSFTVEVPTEVPEGIRCQYKLDKPNQCLEEATWIIHLDPMECGHPDPRSNHHRYCDEHFWNKLQYIATNRAITECTECGDAKRSRPRFIGVEKL